MKVVKIYTIKSIGDDEVDLDPYIFVEVGSERLKYHALIDSGAHLNVVSWNIYAKLKRICVQLEGEGLMPCLDSVVHPITREMVSLGMLNIK